jgi:hypothetical protein
MALVESAYDQALAAAPKQLGADGQLIVPEITIDRNMPLSDTAMQETLAKELKRRRDAIGNPNADPQQFLVVLLQLEGGRQAVLLEGRQFF